jgi:hypothetical protein
MAKHNSKQAVKQLRRKRVVKVDSYGDAHVTAKFQQYYYQFDQQTRSDHFSWSKRR